MVEKYVRIESFCAATYRTPFDDIGADGVLTFQLILNE
jgi:hypothetical protein